MVPGGTLRLIIAGSLALQRRPLWLIFVLDYLVTSVGAIESDGALMEFDVNEANGENDDGAREKYSSLVADHTKYHASAAAEIG